jgi:hypothetical protein
MPTIPAVQRQAELSSREEFLALLCADEELLRAEFEEIIAAEWPDPPPDTPGGEDPAECPPGSLRGRVPAILAGCGPGHDTPAWADGHGNAHPRRAQPPTPKGRKAGDVHA